MPFKTFFFFLLPQSLSFFLLLSFFNHPCGVWDLSSPTRDWTHPCPLYWKHGVSTTGPPGKSLSQSFICDVNCLSLSLSQQIVKNTLLSLLKYPEKEKFPLFVLTALPLWCESFQTISSASWSAVNALRSMNSFWRHELTRTECSMLQRYFYFCVPAGVPGRIWEYTGTKKGNVYSGELLYSLVPTLVL